MPRPVMMSAMLLVLAAVPAIVAAQAQPPKRDTAQKLPAATVRDSTDGLPEPFLRRSRGKGGGKFLTAADIAKMGLQYTPQLLARVSGGSVRDVGGEVAIAGRRGNSRSFNGPVENALCLVAISVNETAVTAGFDIKTIKSEDIAALEFYNGPSTVPPELRAASSSDLNCGLLVIWLNYLHGFH